MYQQLRPHTMQMNVDWTCVPCGVTIHKNDRAPHEAGAPHRRAVAQAQAAQLACKPCRRPAGSFVSRAEFDEHLLTARHINGGELPAAPIVWLCGLCGKGPKRWQWYGSTRFRHEHEAGTRHQRSLDRRRPRWYRWWMKGEAR